MWLILLLLPQLFPPTGMAPTLMPMLPMLDTPMPMQPTHMPILDMLVTMVDTPIPSQPLQLPLPKPNNSLKLYQVQKIVVNLEGLYHDDEIFCGSQQKSTMF